MVFWQKFRLDDFDLGLFRISSFNRAFFDDYTVDLIAGLLANQLKDTDGIVLDIRDNTGGSVAASASLVQLFKENPVSMTGKFKITEETKSLYSQTSMSEIQEK